MTQVETCPSPATQMALSDFPLTIQIHLKNDQSHHDVVQNDH